jgi:beta-galactosidase
MAAWQSKQRIGMGDEKRDGVPTAAGNGMRRRDFLRLSVLAPLSALAACAEVTRPAPLARADIVPDGRPHRFRLAGQQFLLDGKPFAIHSGEMHPIRIPREYWRQRIRMAKAMGLNTISLYVMWN